jgi:uncharacterized damage-inducible protein DinB
MSAALKQNLDLIRQGIELLDDLEDDVYRGEADCFETSYRVGPHLRHCIDAYRCLLDGVGASKVDYDGRSRDRLIEGDRNAGLAALTEVRSDVKALAELDPHTAIRVKVDTPDDAGGAWSRSTLRRELQFLVGHTVHHYALIAMILRQNGVEPGQDFGVAPSTLRHWERERSMAGRSA